MQSYIWIYCSKRRNHWVSLFDRGCCMISCVVSSGQSEGAGPASVSGWVHSVVRTQEIPSPCFPVRGPHPLQQDQKDWRRIWHLHLQTVLQGTECDVCLCFMHRVSSVRFNWYFCILSDGRDRNDRERRRQRPALWDLVSPKEIPGYVHPTGQFWRGEGRVDQRHRQDPVAAGLTKPRSESSRIQHCFSFFFPTYSAFY